MVKDETIWLTQKAMAELFDVNVPGISKHLKNIYEEGELSESATVSILETVQNENGRSVKRNVSFYNLDAIISVGYRVNSAKATKFRIWQQITDIFAECSIDYDKDSEITKKFFATVQNKFHYAITGQTAAEIVYERADHKKDHMGLTTWKNSPSGRVLKSDVNIAKNYLSEKQIRQLERAVSGYFDYIEDLIEREIAFNMEQFAASVNEFLEFRRYDILDGNGKVSRDQADEKAFGEYEIFNRTQKVDSDFDKAIRKMKKN